MDGHAAQGELTATDRWRQGVEGIRFELATPADDPEVRRLLRENPMPGAVAISLEREPDARFAAAIEGDVHHTLVARDLVGGRIVAMGSVSVRDRFVNGQPSRVGYLGQLRLDRAHRNRASIIRGGYAYFRQLHESLGCRLYLTSIASDNLPARRLLERGLPGMPIYRPICDFVTVVLRRRRNGEFQKVTARARGQLRQRGLTLRHGAPDLMAGVVDLLNAAGACSQFAPVWSVESLTPLTSKGLRDSHFRIAYASERPIACAAVWDQRAMKQAVVRSYPTVLRWGRVPLNLLAPFTDLPWLPPVGRSFPQAFISHVAVPQGAPELVGQLIELLHGSANSLGADCLIAGFDARDPALAMVRRQFGGREYHTRLYAVYWPDGAAAADGLDSQRIVAPEVAQL